MKIARYIEVRNKNPRTLRSSRRGDGNVYPEGVSPAEMPAM